MPKGTITASEIDPAIIDTIHCPVRHSKGEKKKPVEEAFPFCPQVHLSPNQDLNKM